MAKKRVYKMWALFNTNRPPIFVEMTRRECVTQGINWIGGEREFARHRRQGWITVEKVTVVAASTNGAGTK